MSKPRFYGSPYKAIGDNRDKLTRRQMQALRGQIKRGKPDRARLIAQLTRYAQCEQLTGLILVAEKSISLPRTTAGKPLQIICLNRLWGIAL